MAASKPNCHAAMLVITAFPQPHTLSFHNLISSCADWTSETASSSSTSISQKLNKDLFDCFHELLLLPLTRQALAREQNDELLDGSLRLLDVCSIAKDTLLQTKEYTLEILSIIRRRRGGKTELATEVKTFLTIRKVMKRVIRKALGNLKGVSPFNKEHEVVAVVSMLKEVEAVTQTA